jgi:peptidoglycan/LPS O-acetylase OafA/YrhL
MHTNQVQPRRIKNNFDSLRLIFALLVVVSHSFPLTRGTNDTEPLSRLTGGQITFGNISVWAFFVISGLLITQSWMRSPSPISFLKRRVQRIYPGFIAAGLVSALLFVPLAAQKGSYFPVSLQSFLFQTLRLQTFDIPPVFLHNPTPDILNGSLWSIPYEFWCYIGVILLGLTAALRHRYVAVSVFVLAIAFHLYLNISHRVLSGGILGAIFGYPPFWATVLPFFVAGMLFHLYGGRSLLRTPLLFAALVLLIASAFVPNGLVVTMPTCGAYLLMWLAYWPALHPLHLGRFGDFSYGTYLYAFPIQQLLVMHFGGRLQPLALFAMAAPLSLMAGAISWFLIEKHFLSRRAEFKHEGLALNAASTNHPPAPEQPTRISMASDTEAVFAQMKP